VGSRPPSGACRPTSSKSTTPCKSRPAPSPRFSGHVAEINEDQLKVKVLVTSSDVKPQWSSTSRRLRSSRRSPLGEHHGKKVVAVVKIQLEAGGATPAPPVGTALGPHGIQRWSSASSTTRRRVHARTVIPVDSPLRRPFFTFVLKTPPTRSAAARGRCHQRPRIWPGREDLARSPWTR